MACKLTTNTISSIPSPLTLSTATCVCGLPFVFIFINYCILSMKMKRMLDLKLRNEQNSNSNVIYSPCCKLRFQIDRFIFFFALKCFIQYLPLTVYSFKEIKYLFSLSFRHIYKSTFNMSF